MRVHVARQSLSFARPLQTAYGTLSHRTIFVLALSDATGATGRGEAAPLQAYDGVSDDRVAQALEIYRPLLEAYEGSGPTPSAGGAGGQGPAPSPAATLLDACRQADDLPQALAAVDLALWDMAGRQSRTSVASLLVDTPAPAVTVNASIAALDRAGAAEQGRQAVQAGFSCLKLKVGVGDDAGRVAAVRAAAGPEVQLRLDANGAWSPEQAVRMIGTLAPAGLELVEEPVRGLEATRWVRERVAVRVAIDETASEPGALAGGAADAVCLKISSRGGISNLLAAASLVRASGAEPYLASTYDGPLGIAAAVHAAAALSARGPLPACGLATLGLFEGSGDAFLPEAGTLGLPGGCGLGVTGEPW